MRYVVGVAEMKVSREAGDELVTYALGSCLGVAIHDAVAGVGGLLHVMLPLSAMDPSKAMANPCTFVDTGVPKLFRACYESGAQRHRLVVKVAGGASPRVSEDEDSFQIGRRNVAALRDLLLRNGLVIRAHDVGGTHSRTVSLCIGSGEVTVHGDGRVTRL